MEVAELKILLRSPGDQDDAYLGAVLPLVKEAVRSYVGEPFIKEDDGTDLFPATVKMAIVKWVQAFSNPAGVDSQSLGAASFSFSAAAIPKEVRDLLDLYKRGNRAFGFIPAPRRTPAPGAPYWYDLGGGSDVE